MNSLKVRFEKSMTYPPPISNIFSSFIRSTLVKSDILFFIVYNGLKIGEGGILPKTLIEAETLILVKCSIEEVSATLANFFVMGWLLFCVILLFLLIVQVYLYFLSLIVPIDRKQLLKVLSNHALHIPLLHCF